MAVDYSPVPAAGTSSPDAEDPGFAWVAMMLVDPAWRGRGIGRRLLEAAVDSVPSDRPIRLDATPMGRPLYASYGFEDEARLTRHLADVLPPGPSEGEDAAPVPDLRPVADSDLPGLIAADRQIFKGDRAAVLRAVCHRAPQYAWIAPRVAGPPRYCLGRQGRLFDQIGPVISNDHDGARALVTAALREAEGRAVALDVFDHETDFAAWLHTRGFRAQRPLFRMRRPAVKPRHGAAPPNRSPLVEFAVLGPEFG
jgi:hypothetical protein